MGDTAQLECKTFSGSPNEQNDNATFVPDSIRPVKAEDQSMCYTESEHPTQTKLHIVRVYSIF